MKIMSFNTQHCKNYIEGNIDFEIMAKAIVDCGADIVGLNEMRGEGPHPDFTAQTERLAELTGMHCYFAPALHLKKGLYGNAILSKYPIERVENIPIPDPDVKKYNGYYETRCVLKATLEGGITVLVTHFGLNPDEQENAVRTVLTHTVQEKCILMGDFNVVPSDPVLAPIREKMTDTASAFEGERFSVPSDAPTKKIDYIFVSKDVTVMAADIPAIVASDHRPHTAEVEL
ncbi:MAG: endonuclease/exonuclease/phosphatase family protein [Clostridia bacterium]|nr:endonuclease/exonuclease/phosphatase family protein [Clostridia bacterium]